jgi:predicted adenylyl cyclase CyaB
MKNIELKVSLDNFKDVNILLNKYKAIKSAKLKQVDTYYNCKNGRLKLREINKQEFELIFYSRPNTQKSKVSSYSILKLYKDQIASAKSILTMSYGEKVVVKKERVLWLYKNTRVHLDKVDRLGCFLELETVVNKISMNEAKQEQLEVIKKLELNKYKKLDKSYSDMLIKLKSNK